jgi:hypothetical protein
MSEILHDVREPGQTAPAKKLFLEDRGEFIEGRVR